MASESVVVLECRLLPNDADGGSEWGAWCAISLGRGLGAVVQYLLKDGLLLPAELHVTPDGEWARVPGPSGMDDVDSADSLRRKAAAIPPVGIGKHLLESVPMEKVDEACWAAIAGAAQPGSPLRTAAAVGRRTRRGKRPSPDELLLSRAEDYIEVYSLTPRPDKPVMLLAKKWGVADQRARKDLQLARERSILVGYDREAHLGPRGIEIARARSG